MEKSSKTSKREKKRQKFGAVDPQLTSDLVGKKAEAGAESTPVENDAMETEDAAKPAPAKNLSELRERLALRLKAMKASRSTGNKPMGAKNKSAGPKSNGSAAKAKAVAAENGQDKAGKRRKIYDKLTASMGDSPTPIKENISFGVIEVDGKGKKDSGEDAKRGGGKILRVQSSFKRFALIMTRFAPSRKEETLEMRSAWLQKKSDVMERRAQGEKVIDDDAKVIKKKLRHLESKKKKSAKAWADRKATQKAAFRDRYDKRDANIEAKRKQRVNKRLKRKGINVPQEPGAKKSKRMRAGFEGRRSRSVN